MHKLKKTDYVFLVLLGAAWGFYFLYDGQTKFDINKTFNIPLIVAIEITLVCFLYGIWRYFSIKAGKQVSARDFIGKIYQPAKDENEENNTENK